MRRYCLKHLKNKIHACKTRQDIKSKAWSASRTRSERDQNEIGTRYKFAQFETIKGQDSVAFQYTLRFPYWGVKPLETPQTGDTRLKNEIGMNFGKKFPPPLICQRVAPPIPPLASFFIWHSFSGSESTSKCGKPIL